MEITLPNNWRPRPYQWPAWKYLQDGGKRCCLVWPRRHGKDEVALHHTACAAMERVATYWHMLPQAEQARRAIWEAVNPHTGRRRIDEAFPKAIRATTRENEMMIRFVNGSTWQVVGSDNFNSLVGSPPAGLVISEWALADPQAWAYLSPILMENGGWVLFITTPRGRNHAADTFELAKSTPGWFGELLTADDTKLFSPEALTQAKAELCSIHGREFGEALFRQEYYCSWSAGVMGAYYGSLMEEAENEGRICRVPHDKGRACYTSWDLGHHDSTAIWVCQVAGREVRFIDYIEGSGAGLDFYAKELADRGYKYERHFLPHDADSHDIGTGLSRIETLSSLRVRPTTVVPKLGVEDGINAVRRLLPRAVFDRERCARGLDCLRNYKRAWNDKTKTFNQKPLHDWTSDGADSLRYMAVGLGESGMAERVKPRCDAWSRDDDRFGGGTSMSA